MSSNARKEERRRLNETQYVRECEDRSRAQAEFNSRFGDLEAALEKLGIEPWLLHEWASSERPT